MLSCSWSTISCNGSYNHHISAKRSIILVFLANFDPSIKGVCVVPISVPFLFYFSYFTWTIEKLSIHRLVQLLQDLHVILIFLYIPFLLLLSAHSVLGPFFPLLSSSCSIASICEYMLADYSAFNKKLSFTNEIKIKRLVAHRKFAFLCLFTYTFVLPPSACNDSTFLLCIRSMQIIRCGSILLNWPKYAYSATCFRTLDRLRVFR